MLMKENVNTNTRELELVKSGDFREDLFHRLNVIKLSLPKLNERKEDIPELAKHFFKKSSEELKEEKNICLKK